MDLNQFKLDPEKEAAGVWWYVDQQFWTPATDLEDGRPKILLTYFPNQNFERRRDELERPHRRRRRQSVDLPLEEKRKITARAVAETVWLDSRHVEFNGQEIGNNVARKYAVLSDPDPRLGAKWTDEIIACANDDEAYGGVELEEDQKN